MASNQALRNQKALSFLKTNYPFSLVLVSVIVESYPFIKSKQFQANADQDYEVLHALICGTPLREIAVKFKLSQQKVQRISDRFMAQFWEINGAALDVEFNRKQRLI